MARPPLPIGAHGEIRVVRAPGGWEASCRFRDETGTIRRLKRVRKTKESARNDLKDAVVQERDKAVGGEVKAESRFRDVAELWFAEFELQVTEGRKATKTRDIYRTYLDRHVLPALGELRMSEVDTRRCEALLAAKRHEGAKDDKLAGIRNVVNNACSHAVRLGAMKTNPVRELSRLQRVDRKKVRALTPAERDELLSKLSTDEEAQSAELADVLRGLLATGLRVSELLGCCGDDVLLASGKSRSKLTVAHRTVRVKGKGITRQARRSTSSKGDEQTLWLPHWVVPMLRERKLASGGDGPLFPDASGWWRSNDSVSSPLRKALDRLGFDWVTSHVMRKTVANELKAAGMTTRQIADQLGQRSTAVTERHYLEQGAANEDQAAILDEII